MKSILHFLFLALLVCSGCSTQNMFRSSKKAIAYDKQEAYVHKLRVDDKLSVSIWNHDDLSIGSVYGIYNSNEVYGKWILIDSEGYAELPKVGKTYLRGLTLLEAERKLKTMFAQFIKDPILKVRVLNLKVTVLGEVKTKGEIALDKENNNLMEIIGRAGGLDFYANKKKVKLIRTTENGERLEFEYDLTEIETIQLCPIRVYPDDIIYVPTKKGKQLDKKAPTLIPFTSVASSLAVLITVFGTK